MPAGEPFTPRQVEEISRAVRLAGEQAGLHFSAFVGTSEGDPRSYAERLHAALGPVADGAVTVHVDPAARRVEVVTGSVAHSRVDDRACGLAALSMSSAFAGGDLAGGLVTGLRMLADSAGRVRG